MVSEDKKNLIRSCNFTYSELHNLYGLSRSSIDRLCKKENITLPRRKKDGSLYFLKINPTRRKEFSAIEKEIISSCKYSLTELKDILQINRIKIVKFCEKESIILPSLVKLSQKNKKLTSNILELYSNGYSDIEISKELNINRGSVHRFLNSNNKPSNKKIWLHKIDDKVICSKCNILKDMSDFTKCKKCKEGINSYCNECRYKAGKLAFNEDVCKLLCNRFLDIKSRSKRKNIPINITKESLLTLYSSQNGFCFYTGVKMTWTQGVGFNRFTISVDKIVPDLGYTDGNIVLCTRIANMIKQDLSLKELKMWVPKFYKKLLKHNYIEDIY